MSNAPPETPNGYHTVTPYLTVDGAHQLIDFIETVFDGRVTERILRPNGRIAHADVRIGDSTIMMSDATDQWPSLPSALYVYVHNTDETYRKGVLAGAESIMTPADQFHGDRMAGLRDAWGNVWWVVTHLEQVPADELQRRADAQLRRS